MLCVKKNICLKCNSLVRTGACDNTVLQDSKK